MKILKILIASFLFNFDAGEVSAQNNSSLEIGYATLIIKIKGNPEKAPKFSTPLIGNIILYGQPIDLQTINDSTKLISLFSMGPTPVFFHVDTHFVSALLLPNTTSQLEITVNPIADPQLVYSGPYPEFFDQTQLIMDRSQEYMMQRYKGLETQNLGIPAAFKTSHEYLLQRMQYLRHLQDSLTKDIESDFIKKYLNELIEDLYKSDLISAYDQNIQNYNRYIGLDSAQSVKNIPPRLPDYYQYILSDAYIEPDAIMRPAYVTLLKSIREDPVLTIPKITEVGPFAVKKKLETYFSTYFTSNENLFFDLLIASLYLDLIEKKEKLNNQQLFDLQDYFKNNKLSTYLRYAYEKAQEPFKIESSKTWYLPFEKTKQNILADILQQHRGKLIVVDFWATWCGPCIAAFDEIKLVKEHYKNRDDLVFINITNETSEPTFWNKMADLIEAEHYYLYTNQVDEMFNTYKIEHLPSYLLFDKNGNLSQKHIHGYMGNETLMKWIEKASK